MSDLDEMYALWDDFLTVWPAERLSSMTLDEYSLAGSKETFTYWIESRLDQLGSIWGGSAFKFGVYSRKDTDAKPSDAKYSYSATHAWYSTLGATAEAAFEKVREILVKIAALAAHGDLDGLENLDGLGQAMKWKVAFHYQNRSAPTVVDIFKKEALASFLGESASMTMGALQKATLAQKPAGMRILEFGRQTWEAWSLRNLPIWKLSHGTADFSSDERERLLRDQLVVVNEDTKKGQGESFKEAEIGTLFYLCHGNEKLVLIGQFVSGVAPSERGRGYLQRRYRVLKPAISDGAYEGPQKGWTPNYRSTFKQVNEPDLPEFERVILRPFFNADLAELAALAGETMELFLGSGPATGRSSVTLTALARQVAGAPINRIYYGPPGTGKTYKLARMLERSYAQVLPLTTEQWRQQLIAERFATLTWWEGVAAALYDLGGKARVNQIAEHPFVAAIVEAKQRTQAVKQTLWATLQHHTIETSKTVNTKLRMAPAIFDKSDDSVWALAGDWREVCDHLIERVDQLKAGRQETSTMPRYSCVTFHQSYGYEEFIEGLRPVLNREADEEAGDIQYEVRPGVFKELCRKARKAPEQRFAIFIDEINRGNISKIFGELITLIEVDKRDPLDGSPSPFEVTLAYSGEKFSVPANVDIVGAMNTADRSLALLDIALRRRFEFIAVLPDTREEKDPSDPDSAPLAGLNVTTGFFPIDVCRMLKKINERIEALYDRDHCIGHAYFMELKRVPDGKERLVALASIFRQRIVPLLEEYFFEDWQKIRLVLGDNQKKDAQARFICESQDHGEDLVALFGGDHGLEAYTTKHRYQIQESAFLNPEAYLGIYQQAPT